MNTKIKLGLSIGMGVLVVAGIGTGVGIAVSKNSSGSKSDTDSTVDTNKVVTPISSPSNTSSPTNVAPADGNSENTNNPVTTISSPSNTSSPTNVSPAAGNSGNTNNPVTTISSPSNTSGPTNVAPAATITGNRRQVLEEVIEPSETFVSPTIDNSLETTWNSRRTFTQADYNELESKISRNRANFSDDKVKEANDILDNIRKLRFNDLTHGKNWKFMSNDVIVDSMNDLRYVFWSYFNDDLTPMKELVKILRKNTEWDIYFTKNNTGGFKHETLNNLVDFFAFKDTNFDFIRKMEKGSFSIDGKTGASLSNDMIKSYYKKMDVLKPTYSAFAWAQYRNLQMEYLGSEDAHKWDETNEKMKSNIHNKGLGGTTPILESPIGSSENWAGINNFEGDVLTITNLEAFITNLSFITDEFDLSKTLGHRRNALSPDSKYIGWSSSIYLNSITPLNLIDSTYINYQFMTTKYSIGSLALDEIKAIDNAGNVHTGFVADAIQSALDRDISSKSANIQKIKSLISRKLNSHDFFVELKKIITKFPNYTLTYSYENSKLGHFIPYFDAVKKDIDDNDLIFKPGIKKQTNKDVLGIGSGILFISKFK